MKIDVTKIEGYEEMSAEEKLKALENYEIDTKGFVDKKVFDKTSSELAQLKRESKEKLTEEQRKLVEREEEFNEMKNELEVLKKEKKLSDMKANYLSLGYEDTLAYETAKAFVEGDMQKVFNNQKIHQESIEKKLKAELLKETPKPGAGSGSKKMTKEDLRKMTTEERFKFSTEHPEEYKAIYMEE